MLFVEKCTDSDFLTVVVNGTRHLDISNNSIAIVFTLQTYQSTYMSSEGYVILYEYCGENEALFGCIRPPCNSPPGIILRIQTVYQTSGSVFITLSGNNCLSVSYINPVNNSKSNSKCLNHYIIQTLRQKQCKLPLGIHEKSTQKPW